MVWLMLKLEIRDSDARFSLPATWVERSLRLVLSSIEMITGPNSGVDAHRFVWSVAIKRH